nr:CPBP family intramembrane glutamic endopeptidase [Sphingomonas sp. UV9]
MAPIGEESLFGGFVTIVLLRYCAAVGVGGGALLFAALPGISIGFPVAVLQGLGAGWLYRRARSLWPAAIVHMIL